MIVATHPDFYIAAKPSGIGMHQEDAQLGFITILNELTGEALFPVHRLDKDTSGLLIVARSAEAAAAFGKLFESREIEKYYIALGGNKPRKKQGAIKGDMEKSRNGSWMLTKTLTNPAITYFFSHGTDTGTRLYVLKPISGKTHQLRVALKSIGAPILGDKRYKGAPADRLMLHAMALRFMWHGVAHSYVLPPSELDDFPQLDWSLFPNLTTPWLYPWPSKP
ncbi:RNA pseudouridine synthase [Aliidiomarina halalkaliphila]|uniref:RNA pseudouridine synthase n=1 Tax=Aliidiomarina halalkaliphila TaxID=2593535 RepID=A0A552X569_9GAMM|nr:pseudouridine synthase [Aliidiomarina halalkaliphila]TRW50167.1 RNA pseudouridine synthase [Aliidiomarina halalkaliphila]